MPVDVASGLVVLKHDVRAVDGRRYDGLELMRGWIVVEHGELAHAFAEVVDDDVARHALELLAPDVAQHGRYVVDVAPLRLAHRLVQRAHVDVYGVVERCQKVVGLDCQSTTFV